MADIVISDLPAKPTLLDSDMVVIDDGAQSYRVTGAQLREFLKVNFLPIGTIVYSQSNLASDNAGRLPLFTGETITSADTLYPEFYAWLLAHTELQISAVGYEAAISTFGECPKYVIDTAAKTIRLPKLFNYIKMANTTDGIKQSGENIPFEAHYHIFGNNNGNNAGNFVASDQAVTAPNPDITEGSGWRSWNGSGGGGSYGGDTNTSTGNMITTAGIPADAKNPSAGELTVAHTTLYPWVYAYNAAIPASTAQAAEFQQALSGKVDKADLAEVQCVVEVHDYGVSYCYVRSDGWCEQGGTYYQGSSIAGDNTINFLKQFVNTNYNFIAFPIHSTANASGYTLYEKYPSRTTSSTVLHGQSALFGYSWVAKGYIK